MDGMVAWWHRRRLRHHYFCVEACKRDAAECPVWSSMWQAAWHSAYHHLHRAMHHERALGWCHACARWTGDIRTHECEAT